MNLIGNKVQKEITDATQFFFKIPQQKKQEVDEVQLEETFFENLYKHEKETNAKQSRDKGALKVKINVNQNRSSYGNAASLSLMKPTPINGIRADSLRQEITEINKTLNGF